MSELPRIYASFSVRGTFDPAELTALTGLTPTHAKRAGTPIGRTTKLTRCDLWALDTAGESGWDLSPHLGRVLEQVAPRTGAIRAFLASHDAKAIVHGVVQGGEVAVVVVLDVPSSWIP